MKRIIVLATLLLAASACASNTTTNTNTNTTTPTANVNPATTPGTTATTSDTEITDREKQVWDAIKRKDDAAFNALLTDDFIYVTDDGVHNRAETFDGIKGLDVTDVSLSDWKVLMLDKDAAVVVYTASVKGTSGGQPIPAKPVRSSSAWVNRGGKWMGVYHQETEMEEAAANSPAGNSNSANGGQPAGASHAANSNQPMKPGAPPSADAASADPIAREKMIWSLLQQKNYDAFAGFLADDQLEVEASGLSDKAGTLKSIREFDFSQAALSDFKTVSLDADAVIVTYLVTASMPGAGQQRERASTIWVNRGGKWQAVFHQGTTAKPAAKK